MTSTDFDIRGATALVTGGSRGIGLAIARGLLEAGAVVFIVARNAADCEATAAELSKLGTCIGLPCDISGTAGIESLAAQLAVHTQSLNVLVNNAGATWAAPLQDYPEQQWDTVFDINLKAPFFLIQKLAPLLRKAATASNPSRIINVGSIAGLNTMGRDSYAYAASKAGLHHLTRLLARHLAPHINVNAIAPGAFETRMISFALQDPQNRTALEAQVPRGHVGQAADVAGVAVFLAGRASAYITGAVIPVDGGLSLRNP